MKKIVIVGESFMKRRINGKINNFVNPIQFIPIGIKESSGTHHQDVVQSIIDSNNNSDTIITKFHQQESLTTTRFLDENGDTHFVLKEEDPISPFPITPPILKTIQSADLVVIDDGKTGFISSQVIETIRSNSKLFMLLDF